MNFCNFKNCFFLHRSLEEGRNSSKFDQNNLVCLGRKSQTKNLYTHHDKVLNFDDFQVFIFIYYFFRLQEEFNSCFASFLKTQT